MSTFLPVNKTLSETDTAITQPHAPLGVTAIHLYALVIVQDNWQHGEDLYPSIKSFLSNYSVTNNFEIIISDKYNSIVRDMDYKSFSIIISF